MMDDSDVQAANGGLEAGGDIRDWQEDAVNALLKSLGFPYYEQQIKEHGITGDILIHLDHEALKDVGIHSVGQRLSILKAVYTLKLRDEIPIEQGHWVPPTEDLDQILETSPTGSVHPNQIYDMISDRDDRIRALELEVRRLNDLLSGFREEMQVISKALYNKEPPAQYTRGPRATRSPVQAHFPSSQMNGGPSSMSEAQRIALQQTTRANASQYIPSITGMHSSPADSPSGSPGALVFQHYESSADHIQSSTSGIINLQSSDGSVASSGAHMPLTPAGLSNSVSSPASPGPSSPANFSPRGNPPGTTLSTLTSSTSFSRPATSNLENSPRPSTSTDTTQSNLSMPAVRPSTSQANSSLSSSSDHPYKSFKVTLEDPCYKVLPAALKKYKINDDWREYALFICYGGGSTERCLSYDEKPLLLFQKLKDAKQNPVFMLRHIKDIKSPIQVASAKHAARKEKKLKDKDGPLNSGDTRTAKILKESGGDASLLDGNASTPTVATMAEREQQKEQEAAIAAGEKGALLQPNASDGPHPLPLPSPGSRQIKGYCISIYPYLAEREDEFDVVVGDTFVIVNKAKGWWTVYRDNRKPGSADPEEDYAAHSGWVPAGCLLETSVAPLSLATPLTGDSELSQSAANVPIKPSMIVSVSTPGLALMDFRATGSDELNLVKGQTLRVYKRYNHWSYAIKDDSGDRGWIPSWFCGKVAGHKAPQTQLDSPAQASPATPIVEADSSTIPKSTSSSYQLPQIATI